MCKYEESQGRTGALGRNYVATALAQAVISPTIGKLMDMASKVSLKYFHVQPRSD